ncbi:MAG: hypothetical protein ACRELB_08255, partial [Polyangiaceae bacterium]
MKLIVVAAALGLSIAACSKPAPSGSSAGTTNPMPTEPATTAAPAAAPAAPAKPAFVQKGVAPGKVVV